MNSHVDFINLVLYFSISSGHNRLGLTRWMAYYIIVGGPMVQNIKLPYIVIYIYIYI